RVLLRCWNAETGIVDVEAKPTVAAPAANQHASLLSVFDRIGNEVLQQAPQQPPIRTNGQATWHERECEALFPRLRRELDCQLAQQLVDAKTCDFRLHRPGVEAGYVEERAQDFFDGFERGVDVADQTRFLAGALPSDKARHVQARRVE